jgi:hypothetical protein
MLFIIVNFYSNNNTIKMKNLLFLLFLRATALFAQPEAHITQSHISADLYWTNDSVYIIETAVTIMPGYSLTICPGTTVKFAREGEFRTALRIAKGAKIYADGTAKPIVFTSAQPDPAPGDWMGVFILGAAPESCDGHPLGPNCFDFDNTFDSLWMFGGGSPDDNSGVLRCIRIEYAGDSFSESQDVVTDVALMLAGVGTGTIIDRVEVYKSEEVSFWFLGGTVNCSHLIANQGGYEDFRYSRGYIGKGQFMYSLRDPAFAEPLAGSIRIMEPADPTLSNITVAGPIGPNVSSDYNRLIRYYSSRSKGGIFNSLLLGKYKVGAYFDYHDGLESFLNQDSIEMKNTLIAGPTNFIASSSQISPVILNAWLNNAAFNNVTSTDISVAGLNDAFNLVAPNPLPLPNSFAWDKASFISSDRLQHPFLEHVNYIGAFGSSDWTYPWASWHLWNGPIPNCITSLQPIEIERIHLQINPQPAQNLVEIHGFPEYINLEQTKIEIWGQTGSKINLDIPIVADQFSKTCLLDVSSLPNGSYLLHFKSSQFVASKLLLVIR